MSARTARSLRPLVGARGGAPRACAVVLVLALAALLGAGAPAAAEITPWVFQPIKPEAATDWKGKFGVSHELHEALQRYQTNPSAATAIGVLKHFNELSTMPSPKRAGILAANDALFQSVDFMKYELVMQTRAKLAAQGAKAARRVGSSGQREAEIIRWVENGRQGTPPPMNPEKQFKSDDDVTVMVDNARLEADPIAAESVNGAAAAAKYVEVVREFGYTGDFDPSRDTQTEFLSPTKAWQVVKAREQLNPREMPTFSSSGSPRTRRSTTTSTPSRCSRSGATTRAGSRRTSRTR